MRIANGALAPPTFRPLNGPMRLLGYSFHLVQFELDGSFAAKHGYDHIYRIVFDLNGFHSTGEGGQRTVEDAHSVANSIVDNDLTLFNAHLIYFLIGKGKGVISGCAYKAGYTAYTADHVPGLIAVDHLDKQIAGIKLALISLAYAGLGDLGDGLHRNGERLDLILQIVFFDDLLSLLIDLLYEVPGIQGYFEYDFGIHR